MERTSTCFANCFCKPANCEYHELCQETDPKDIEGAIVIINETDPNTYACFGCDYEGYCDIQECKYRRRCWSHTDPENDPVGTIVILEEE